MSSDDIKPDPTSNPDAGPTPDAMTAHMDPGAMKDAHGRTGRMLKNAGLPFEDDEFEDAEGVDAAKLATGVDAGEAADADPDDDSSSSSSSSN